MRRFIENSREINDPINYPLAVSGLDGRPGPGEGGKKSAGRVHRIRDRFADYRGIARKRASAQRQWADRSFATNELPLPRQQSVAMAWPKAVILLDSFSISTLPLTIALFLSAPRPLPPRRRARLLLLAEGPFRRKGRHLPKNTQVPPELSHRIFTLSLPTPRAVPGKCLKNFCLPFPRPPLTNNRLWSEGIFADTQNTIISFIWARAAFSSRLRAFKIKENMLGAVFSFFAGPGPFPSKKTCYRFSV